MAEPLAGKLLVASPALLDPNFYRSVVLICAHDPGGAFGLVLNYPAENAALVDYLPEWAEAASAPASIFVGGPVQREVVTALGRISADEGPEGFDRVVDGIGMVSLGRPASDALPYLRGFRAFAGYAGWTGGQIEQEIASNSWFVLDPHPDDPFTDKPEGLWKAVLRRQGGELAAFAFFPHDPRAN